MKSLFGKKGAAAGINSSDTFPQDAEQQQQQQQQRQQHRNNPKAQPLIETLRSADTASISATPSTTTTGSSTYSSSMLPSHHAPSSQRPNPQQVNKKLFASRLHTKNHLSISQQQSKQDTRIGYTSSVDPTDMTTTTSFSTNTISLMEPPSQKRHNRHRSRKMLPSEVLQPTSQQQYRPPDISSFTAPTVAATMNESTSEADHKVLLSTSTALTYPRRSVYSPENNLNRLCDSDDGIDQEHYNRLLNSTTQNNDDVVTPSTSHDNDTAEDVVPFASFFARHSKMPIGTGTSNYQGKNDASTSMTAVRFHNNTDTDEIATKIPSKNTCFAKFQYYFVRTGVIYILIVLFTAASMLYGLSDQLSYANRHRHHKNTELTNIQVAFIGNAYFFVNDIPRLLEGIAQGYIYQNSCLHAGGSLSDLWVTGNGMFNLWQTDEAIIEYTTSSSSSSDDDAAVANDDDANVVVDADTSIATTYDYGFCSVLQLLQGYDKYMAYGNKYGKYYSDGLNPCIVDYSYDNFIHQQLQDDPLSWDYIIIVEQTKRMAFAEARNETINFLVNRYGPLIKASGAIPVLVDTHAFWSSKSNMTGLTDIPTFAALIAQGVADFTTALSSVLPSYQAPLVAPIGLAYLTIWEEDYALWQKLFLDDGIHSSVYGSYLFACVLFATLFDQLPTHSSDNGKNEYNNIASLFMDARKIVGQASYPTNDEAEYLRNVAGRVTLRGYVPPSLLDALSTLQQEQQYTNSYSNR